MIARNITPKLLDALLDTPVVLLHGARQTGKSTLVRSLASREHPAEYVTLDDATAMSAAASDPEGFLAGLGERVVLDEAQRVPALFHAIKAEVDRFRRPGRFLLTGSADVFLLPSLSEALAGRIEILTLWPFSQGELESVKDNFVDKVFATRQNQGSRRRTGVRGTPPPSPLKRSDMFGRVLAGGFPEAVARKAGPRRTAWFGSYVTTILQRDVRDLANIERATELPRLLALLAARATSLLNYAELSRSLGLPQSTLKRYMALFETTFLVHSVPAWAANLGKRLVKSPKAMLCDTGLMAHLLGLSQSPADLRPDLIGPLLENFAFVELRKQATWSEIQPRIYHFRTQTGQEVDIILEDGAGNVVGIEVKAAAAVTAKDFAPLRFLSETLGERFVAGVVLYTGHRSVPFAANLHALPLSALWTSG